jgi:hypothetical protein
MIKDETEMSLEENWMDLTGPDGNAFVLLGNAKRWASQLSLDWDAIHTDATSDDYDHLVDVMEDHFGEYVTFYR